MSEHDEAAVGDPWAPMSDSADTSWPAPPSSQKAREDVTDLDHEQWVREQMGDIDADDADWDTPTTDGPAPDGTADEGGAAEDVEVVDVAYGGSLGPSIVEPVDLDADMQPPVDLDLSAATNGAASKPHRFDKKVALGFGGALGAAVLVAAIVSMIFYGGSGEKPVTVRQASVADPAVAAPVAPSEAPPAAAVAVDRPLPYSADAVGSCLPGSTTAQTMTGSDPHNAFVCAREGDGQVIEIDLGKSYVITAISLTPGWVGTDGSGVSQWSQHRVVTTVQYTFNDTDRSLVTQETKNVHGEAVQPIKRVMASKIRMLIRETSRPPADPSDESAEQRPLDGLPALPHTPPPAGYGDPLFGSSPNSDPVDATFAISNLKIIGHEPL
jgi:hypothetical protein